MSFLIEKIVRVNGEERARETMVADYATLEGLILPVATITQQMLTQDAHIEVELKFDPALIPRSDA